MDSTPVNWEALDRLILDFAESENLIEDSASTISSFSFSSRLIIRQIRRFVESGDIDSSRHLLRSHAPFILDDHRLFFRLQKQKFIELLRRATDEARNSAIECIRTALAPCALDAYPEAYEEFKHILLAFIYDKDDKNSPVANEWPERRRFEIAGLISSVLRAHLQSHDPVFLMTIRYLMSIHKGFCIHQGILLPTSDLTVRLLLEEHNPPAVPQLSFYEAPPFDEVDIQALAHAVELTRQGAIDSLRFAKGDLFLAFQNELCQMRVDVSMLDELVREYCVYRGIVNSCLGPSSDCGTSVSNAHMKTSPEDSVDVNRTQGTDVELRYESTSNYEDCSTSGSHQAGSSKVLQRNRTYTTGESSKRKQWRGRQDDEDYKLDLNTTANSTNLSREQQGMEKHSSVDIHSRDDKYEIVLGMKELASRGMAEELVEEVTADPNFFVQNHILLFQLKQIEFLKLVSSGDLSSALRVACSHLGPIAASDPSLLKPLKDNLLALLQPNEDALGKGLPLHALSTSFQVAIGRKLDIEEPQLMKLMRATLHSHNEWFRLQMCKDRFESLLMIDSLKDVHSPLISACSMSNSIADSYTHGSSQVALCSSTRVSEDGSSPTRVSSGDVCDENAILKEFLALPRVDAIHLLAEYNGNAETVIQQIFA